MVFSIKNWISSFQKYFFYYRDGFYEMPFLANSPELMVKSFQNMPFMKNHPQKCFFTTNNLFISGEGHYQKLEEGLWLIMSDIEIKRDLSFKLYYEPDIPSDYHFLSIYLSKSTKTISYPKLEMDIEFADQTWSLFKAGSKCLNSHFKGQKSIILTIYFSKEWVNQNIANNGILKNKILEDFFTSQNDYLHLPNFLGSRPELYQNIVKTILDKDENGVKDKLLLKKNTLEILSSFVEDLQHTSIQKKIDKNSENERRKIVKVEHLINESILGSFPSIGFLAKEVGISETKLKSDFKEFYGTTLYQYFSSRQMDYARQILKNEKITVREVAYTLGYSNASKFAAAFKRTHGFAPSEIQ